MWERGAGVSQNFLLPLSTTRDSNSKLKHVNLIMLDDFERFLETCAMKKTWLIRVYRGLYYPVVWGL